MPDIKNVLVVGGGLMGKNIAFAIASVKDYQITIYDINYVDVYGDIEKNTRQLVEKAVITEEELEERLSRIKYTGDLKDERVAEADLVIEAVFEDMNLKQELFAQLESVCSADCIFCTNTSVMSPTEISAKLGNRKRFIGTHFWNPGHLIPLVEVVKTADTDEKTVKAVMDFMTKIGKEPCLCNMDTPGFIANRLQHALWREAISIVERGIADAATVDRAVKNSFGLRLPKLAPLENADMVGLDLTYNIHNYVLKHLEDSHQPSPLLTKMKEEGKLGFKTGQGFYKWTDEEKAQSAAGLNEYLIKMLYDK